jgi:EH domain-containing protein 1
MYEENHIDSLRAEILEMVEKYLTPVAIRYGYSDSPLETNIKWRPLVLVIGNYSSGKSTLINEFLDAEIQATGQAPTDDSFTILTYGETPENDPAIRTIEERDGKFLLNDPEYPFESLKKHGQRFASHFRLKKVNSPFLKNIAIIDTPGMLDSITERDRGYNYQDVIGDFAHIADLVLVLFDPHKAGTVREAYMSLRETLPARTFEDRVLVVLNRIDECESLIDLLRVYGTLCWNLSQMTGRKDIPMIHLTYSHRVLKNPRRSLEKDPTCFLNHLENQREELKKAILQAPRHRLDNLATFVEIHGERLCHLLEGLMQYGLAVQKMNWKFTLTGLALGIVFGGAAILALMGSGITGGMEPGMLAASGVTALFMLLWTTVVKKYRSVFFHRKIIKNIDTLTNLHTQTRRDTWAAVRPLVLQFLEKTGGRFPLKEIKKDYANVRMVFEKGAKEIREALNDLSTIRHDSLTDKPLQDEPRAEPAP